MAGAWRRKGLAIAAWSACLVAGLGSTRAHAQTILNLDGTLSLRYSETTPATSVDSGLTTLVSPAVTLQVGAPRLVYRIGYVFAGAFNLYGGGANSYFNQLTFSLAAEPGQGSALTTSASISQGGTAFLLSQRPADVGQPAIRQEGNPDQIWAALSESYRWELSRSLRMTQGLTGALVAPRYSLEQSNAQVGVSLALDHATSRDAVGGVFSSNVALLRPLAGLGDPYYALANSLVARWAHDFGTNWNAELSGGVAHVIQLVQDGPEAFLPTGSVTAGYLANDVGRSGGALSFNYGPYFDLQTGGLTRAASVAARGHVNLDPLLTRQLTFSAGYLRSWAMNEAAALNLAGLGQAVQGDAGFVWGLSPAFLITARISVAYQYGRPAGLEPSLVYVFLLGITGRYSNAPYMADLPAFGNRVDGADGGGFSGSPSTRD